VPIDTQEHRIAYRQESLRERFPNPFAAGAAMFESE